MSTFYEELVKELKENSSHISQNKITLSYKSIVSIGHNIPEKFTFITKLYLSNNKLYSLSGIEIFKCLTHLSISFNNIEKFEELDRISNKDNLLSLSVKGNLFCKNPLANVLIINKFCNLKDLDGFKISDATYKVIEETKRVRNDIIPFIYVLSENFMKIEKLSQTILINLELETKYNMTDKCPLEEKLQKITLLLNKIGIMNYFNSENSESKYLKKNINPSIYVIRKIIESFVPNRNFLISNFTPPDRHTVSQVYERLFSDLINSYTVKKNYTELPMYLNYLILKSHPLFEKFFFSKVVENGDYSGEKSPPEILKYICKNFDRLFVKYTNYGLETLIKLQMTHFYYLQPPIAKIHSDYKPIYEQSTTDDLVIKNENKNLTNDHLIVGDMPRSKSPGKNPFTSRLNQASDIVPGKNIKCEFIKRKYDYEYTINFASYDLDFYYEDGIEKINIDNFYNTITSFLNNYSPLEFPLFCLNFDYMRIVTSLIQEKIYDYLNQYEKIQSILNQIKSKIDENRERMKPKRSKSKFSSTKKSKETKSQPMELFLPVKTYESIQNSDYPGLNKNSSIVRDDRSFLGENDFNAKSKRTNRFSNIPNEKANRGKTNPHTINLSKSKSLSCSRSPTNSRSKSKTNRNHHKNYNESFIDKSLGSILNKNLNQDLIDRINKKKDFFSKILSIFNKVKKQKCFDKFKNFNQNKRTAFLIYTLDKLDHKLQVENKMILFNELVSFTNLERKIDVLQNRKLNKIKSKFFNTLKFLLVQIDISKIHRRRTLLGRIFYKIVKHYYNKKYTKQKKSHSRVYYYNKLIKKVMQSFKMSKYLNIERNVMQNHQEEFDKKSNLNESYSKVYNFFHSGNEFLKEIAQNSSLKENYIQETRMEPYKESDFLGRTNLLEHKYMEDANKKYNYNYKEETFDETQNELESLLNRVKKRCYNLSSNSNNRANSKTRRDNSNNSKFEYSKYTDKFKFNFSNSNSNVNKPSTSKIYATNSTNETLDNLDKIKIPPKKAIKCKLCRANKCPHHKLKVSKKYIRKNILKIKIY